MRNYQVLPVDYSTCTESMETCMDTIILFNYDESNMLAHALA